MHSFLEDCDRKKLYWHNRGGILEKLQNFGITRWNNKYLLNKYIYRNPTWLCGVLITERVALFFGRLESNKVIPHQQPFALFQSYWEWGLYSSSFKTALRRSNGDWVTIVVVKEFLNIKAETGARERRLKNKEYSWTWTRVSNYYTWQPYKGVRVSQLYTRMETKFLEMKN